MIDNTHEETHGPAIPPDQCPLCRSPKLSGGLTIGNYRGFECGTSAEPSGSGPNGVHYRNAYKISPGLDCLRNLAEVHEKAWRYDDLCE